MCEVNRKILLVSQLRRIFALSSPGDGFAHRDSGFGRGDSGSRCHGVRGGPLPTVSHSCSDRRSYTAIEDPAPRPPRLAATPHAWDRAVELAQFSVLTYLATKRQVRHLWPETSIGWSRLVAIVSQRLAGSCVTDASAAVIAACQCWNGWTLSPNAACRNSRTPTQTC